MEKTVVRTADVDGKPEYKGRNPEADWNRFEDAMETILHTPSPVCSVTDIQPEQAPAEAVQQAAWPGQAGLWHIFGDDAPAGVKELMLLSEQMQPVIDATEYYAAYIEPETTEFISTAHTWMLP